MGPRLMSRGKLRAAGRCPSRTAGFNGAAAHEPRKEIELREVADTPSRFNGAAAHEPRKATRPGTVPQVFDASMGPRLMSRGKAALATCFPVMTPQTFCEQRG